jgi:Fic family protein
MQAPEPLTAEQLAVIDAAYSAIPAFGNWPAEVPGAGLWAGQRDEIQSLKARATPDALDAAVRTAMRAAAWDTGALEGLYKTDRGLTMTVATQAAAWEREISDRVPDARAYFDAQLQAYELVMDVATQARPVHEVWVRHLHEVLTAPQQTYTVQTVVGPQERALPRGEYKSDPNHVKIDDGSIHAYAPIQSTGPEMARLVAELNSDEFVNSHPITQASYTHYCLAAIHPFADGNGRVARAVASTYLYRAASIPLLVLADQRDQYLISLQAADRGDYAPFVQFVDEAVRSATGMVIEGLRTALAPKPDDTLASLRTILTAQGGLSHRELDAVASRLGREASTMLDEVVGALDLPPGVTSGHVNWGDADPTEGYRVAHTDEGRIDGASGIWFEASQPARAERGVGVQVLVSTEDAETETFLLAERSMGVTSAPQTLALGLRDVYPELTVAAQYRIRAFIERLVGVTLDRFAAEARKSLEKLG